MSSLQTPPVPAENLGKPSYASATRRMPSKGKAVLVTKFAPDSDLSSVNRKYFDSLFNLRSGGPAVQSFRRTDDTFFLEFPTIEQRNKAQTIATEVAAPFEKVYVPEKHFPLLVKFTGLMDVDFPSPSDAKSVAEGKERDIIEKLCVENQRFTGQMSSLRVLNRIHCSDTKTDSYLVRLCLKSAEARQDMLRSCALSLDGEYHRVDKVDLNREVRRCTKCQSYKHGTKSCRSEVYKCARCGQNHPTKGCPLAEGSPPSCCNCSEKGHSAGDHSCKAHLAAVAKLRASYSVSI